MKTKQSGQVRAYRVLLVSEFVFDINLDELTNVSSDSGQFIFYLASNKIQNDPTKPFNINIPNLETSTGYRCDYNGSHQPICSFMEYYHRVTYGSNSVGGWFHFTQYPTTDNEFVLIDRTNVKRG